jgi:biopolymer transport protein ExbD/TolR
MCHVTPIDRRSLSAPWPARPKPFLINECHGIQNCVLDSSFQSLDPSPSRRLDAVSCDMNVTPLIDVLLVLLIIFMSTLPLTQRCVDINLPLETKTTQQPPSDQTQVIVELTADRRLAVNKVACRWRTC